MSKADLQAREAAALAARAKFKATLHTVQHRLSPKTIANDVKELAKESADGAVNAAKDGIVQAATHPSTIAAITIPLAVYFFRKPIARGLNALFGKDLDEEAPAPPAFEAERVEPLQITPLPKTATPEKQGA